MNGPLLFLPLIPLLPFLGFLVNGTLPKPGTVLDNWVVQPARKS